MSCFIKTINALTSLRAIERYLEIGVYRGETFLNIQLPIKTGVDPNFRFDITSYEKSPDIHLFPMTSDLFFASLPEIQQRTYSGKPEFDLIFIDGLHTFEQSLQDFLNSLEYSHQNTLWLLDDVLPCDPYSAIPDSAKSLQLRSLANLSGTPWHGDVFKSLYAIHDFYQDFSYVTIIDNGNPHALLWRTPTPATRVPLFKDRNEIKLMNYFDMCQTCAVLNPVSLGDALSLIGSQVEVPVQLSTAILPSIVRPLRTR